MPGSACHSFKRLVRDLLAVGDIQSLEPDGILRQGLYRLIGNRLQSGHIQGQKTPIILEHRRQIQIR